MMVVEEGRVALHDDITPILPDGLVPGDAALTLAQLMSHRPGFEESFAIFDDAIASLPRVEALTAAAPEQVFPRGEVTSYSNWGVALAGFGLAILLSLTTLAGLIWRHGLAGGSRHGALAAGMAALSAGAVLAFLASSVSAALAAARLGSEFLFDQPQPTLKAVFFTADALVVLAGFMVVSLALIPRAPGWGLFRKLHHCVFAVSLLAFGGMLLHWGLAFGGPI